MVLMSSRFSSLVGTLALAASAAVAFDNTRFDNLAVYWGQNSYGATHSDTQNFQKTLSFYCKDNTLDVIPIAFLTTFFGAGGLPVINLANVCNNVDNATFPGTGLANCAALASDISACQAKGKIVTLSLGGAGGAVGFSDDGQAAQFADQIWNLFLGGSSSTRPFGYAVLDGVDLDIEGGGSTGYVAFVNQLRTHFNRASKKYYITAAPQCVFPDAALGDVLNSAFFDAVYVQFYNNFCGLQNFAIANDWNFGLWDGWARTISPNKNVKIYLGAPASSTAAGSGYQSASLLASIATQMRNSFPSFGGVMMWDESQAFQNSRYDVAIKQALVAAGGTGFKFPSCSAPAYVSGTNYVGGSTVSFQGYIWQAKFDASSMPANDPNNEWSAISACGGSGSAPPSTSSAPPSTTSSMPPPSSMPPSSSSTSSSPTPTGGSCAGVPAWSSTVAYPGGSKVTSGGHLWTAKWWSQADVPGGSAGDWTDDGPCLSGAVAASPAAATSKHGVGTSAEPAALSPGAQGIGHTSANTGISSSPPAKQNTTKSIQNVRKRSSRLFRL